MSSSARPGSNVRPCAGRQSGKARAVVCVMGAVLALTGCAAGVGSNRGIPIELEIPAALTIPASRAHTKFQNGRQVYSVNRYAPWCELEIETLSEEPQQVEPGRFRVRRVQHAFIKDYNARIPAFLGGFSCDDLVFKETFWWLAPAQPSPVIYLRCLAPYVHCRIGPHLSLPQVQDVVGAKVRVRVEREMLRESVSP